MRNFRKVTASVVLALAVLGFGFLVVADEAKKADSKPEKESATQKTTASPATGEQINWQVISSGGTSGSSASYQLAGTVGQTVVGFGSSTNYGLSHGFWQVFGEDTTCCNHDGIRGDVNYDMGLNVADITYMVAYLFQGGPPPPCPEEGDVNGDGSTNVADLTYIVDYLFRGGPPPPACP